MKNLDGEESKLTPNEKRRRQLLRNWSIDAAIKASEQSPVPYDVRSARDRYALVATAGIFFKYMHDGIAPAMPTSTGPKPGEVAEVKSMDHAEISRLAAAAKAEVEGWPK